MLSVRRIYAAYKSAGIKTVVMGASFRPPARSKRWRAAIASPSRPRSLTSSPRIRASWCAHGAENPGQAPAPFDVDEVSFRWALNEDPMATEKLAEGIRQFARDLAKLRTLVTKRLEEPAKAA